jgi:hypothetical protein
MRFRGIVRGLCLSAAVMVGLTGAAHASPSSDAERLAAAGFDVSRLPAGWSLVGNELWWEGGAIRTTIEPVDEDVLPCPDGYLCLYQDQDLGGARFATSLTNRWFYLTNYIMDPHHTWNDQVSSWRNNRSTDGIWYYHNDNPNPHRCMNAESGIEHMGEPDNDEMSRFYTYNSPSSCS